MALPPSAAAHSRVVVMGVCGAGKTTVGALLAAQFGGTFIDADSLHPPANQEKMRSGTPLTDADRAPWLTRVAAALAAGGGDGAPVFIACSALKRAYRRQLLPDAAESRRASAAAPAALAAAKARTRDVLAPARR